MTKAAKKLIKSISVIQNQGTLHFSFLTQRLSYLRSNVSQSLPSFQGIRKQTFFSLCCSWISSASGVRSDFTLLRRSLNWEGEGGSGRYIPDLPHIFLKHVRWGNVALESWK